MASWRIFSALIVLSLLAVLALVFASFLAFVPLVGLAALPLQLIAWVVRGAVFEFIGLTALVAYVYVYRDVRAGGQSTISDSTVHHIGRTA